MTVYVVMEIVSGHTDIVGVYDLNASIQIERSYEDRDDVQIITETHHLLSLDELDV